MKTVKPGIRLKSNGKYLATKSISGKRHYEEFKTLREASKWKNDFHPLVTPVVNQLRTTSTVSDQSNGRDESITFKEVYDRYLNGKMKSLSLYIQYKKKRRMDRFFPPLFSVPMHEMNPEIITRLLEDAKLLATDTFGRSNYDVELKDLKSVFTWYKECDFTFHSPITAYHSSIGTIKEVERKKKDMNEAQLLAFIYSLFEPFQTMAVIQFCLALRISEVAALGPDTVYLDPKSVENSLVTISDSIGWLKGVPVHHKKTKTRDVTTMKMNQEMHSRFLMLEKKRPKGCRLYFHLDGKPMRYDHILEAYNEALNKAGLQGFNGTHFVRHTMGTLARKSSGLDAAQAILRHTTSRMSEHYAKLDVNEKASGVVIDAGEMFSRGRATVATSEIERITSSGT